METPDTKEPKVRPPAKYAPPTPGKGLIYVLGYLNCEEPVINIGWSESITKFQGRKVQATRHTHTGKLESITILALFWADFNDEKALHRYFKNKRHPTYVGEEVYIIDQDIQNWLIDLRAMRGIAESEEELTNALCITNTKAWFPLTGDSRKTIAKGPRNGLGLTSIWKKTENFYAHKSDFSEYNRDNVMEGSFYTPDHITKIIRENLWDRIDLDPASCDVANKGDGIFNGIGADRIYDERDDGSILEWYGKVFLNPPFRQWHIWAPKIESELKSGRVKELIVLASTLSLSNMNVNKLCKLSDAQFFSKSRLQFWGEKTELGNGANRNSTVFIMYFGPEIVNFIKCFQHLGMIAVNSKHYKGDHSC